MQKSFIILIVLLSMTGCRSSNKARAAFDRAETLMGTAPDSALILLNGLDPHSLNSRALRARHALLYSQALDKNGVDLASDSVIAPATVYYAHHGSDRDKAFTNYYHGRICNNAGDTGEAATRMMVAEKYAERAGETDLLGLIYNCRANLYFSQYSFNEALQMYDKADSCFRIEGKPAFSAFMLKAKARVYALQNNNEASIATFKKALNLFDSLGNSPQASMISSSLAFVLKSDRNIPIDSIKHFLYAAYSRYNPGHTPKSDYTIWAWIHLQQKNIDSARYYATRAMQEDWNTSDQRSGLLALVCQIEEAVGNYPAATTHWKTAYKLLDSVADYEKANLIQRAEERYENKELQHQNELLHLRGKLFLSVVTFIFILLAAAFVLTIRHWRRKLRKKSEENKEYRIFIDKLNDDYSILQSQYEEVEAQTFNGEEQDNLLNAVEKRLNALQQLLDMAYTSGCKPQTFYAAFKDYAESMNGDDFAFSDLQFVLNRRYNGVIDYLRREHPGLTPSELNMLSMMVYGFTFDGIRLIFNHENIDSIYSRRTKIREKLGLPPRSKLEKYLKELVAQLKSEKESKKTA